jgi:SAM-dependent methyltransferase
LKSEQFRLHAAIETDHWWFAARRELVSRVIQQLVPPSKNVTIADVGCGTGGNISELATMYSCVGIDTSEEAIELARTRFPQINFICGMAPKCLEADGLVADVFLLLDVLEHVEFDRDFFLELFEALKTGGHMLLTVPANMSLWSPQDVNYGHYRRYEPAQLEALWYGLPVTVKLFSFFNTYLYPVVKAVRVFNKFRGREWGEAGTDLSVPPKPLNRLLRAIYSWEAKPLTNMLASGRKSRFPFGVSLMACLRKDDEPK